MGGVFTAGGVPVAAAYAREPVYAWAPSEPPRRRRRLWLSIGLSAAAVVLAAGGTTTYVLWAQQQEAERIAAAQLVSATEQRLVQAAVASASDLTARVDEGATAYRDAAQRWRESEEAVAAWQREDEAPAVQISNPGGGMPGGEAEERALLDAIGAGDVQLIYDASDQNCGYSSGGGNPRFLAIGGCYNPSYRDWLFLAWDPGITAEQIWPIFVHEAMHWYQWEHDAVYFESAARAGFGADAYREQIESDASCRAVAEHGVPRSAYDTSSAPCDVDGWYDGWLRDQIAALGVPVAAPDPEAFEVEAVVRP